MRQRGAFPKQGTAGNHCVFSSFPRHSSFVLRHFQKIVNQFLQDFLYFTDRPMRNIAALSSP
jgi:hypothetical protein